MKKTFKIIAAALVVSAVMTSIPVAVSADFISEGTETLTLEAGSDNIVGGWQLITGDVSLKVNTAAKKAFNKATSGLTGVSCKAIAVLGTQVVAGTNYCILCRETPLDPDGGVDEIKLMYIYEDLTGNAEITGYYTIIGELLMGGFSANTGKFGLSNNKTVYNAYKKSMKSVTGVSYTPIAYLGSQVVAGTNYLILCRSKASSANAKYKYTLVKIYKDLKGGCKMIDAEELSIGKMDEVQEEIGGMMQIANPWQEYSTVSAAAKAAGVKLTAPDALGSYKISYIQAMYDLAEINYKKGEKEISYRCGQSKDDNTGDYNEYEKEVKEKVGSITVTLRMNGSKVYNAIWTDGKYGYSYFVRNGISKKTALSHIKKLIGA